MSRARLQTLLFPSAARSGQPGLAQSAGAARHSPGQLSKLDLQRIVAFHTPLPLSAGQAKAFEKQKRRFCMKYLTKTDCASV